MDPILDTLSTIFYGLFVLALCCLCLMLYGYALELTERHYWARWGARLIFISFVAFIVGSCTKECAS